jgi:hypothetical protein
MKHFLDGEAFIPNFVSLESQDKRENLKALHLANIKFPFSKYKLILTVLTVTLHCSLLAQYILTVCVPSFNEQPIERQYTLSLTNKIIWH